MALSYQVSKLYRTVVEDVISNVRESFLDDGVDDQVLSDLKRLWDEKLQASKAIEPLAEPPTLNIPRAVQNVRQQVMPGQVPVFAQIPGMSRQPQTITLPAMYGQQFAGQQILQTDQGAIILQSPGQIIRGQVPSAQVRPIQQVIQQGGQVTTSSGLIQLDGASDQPHTATPGCSNTHGLVKGMIIEGAVGQIDGQGDTSSEEDDDDDDKDEDDEDDKEEEEEAGVEEEPLNSGDDVSDEDPNELFDTDNVIVCQYDKINRCKNKWKFGLKDGIMNLNGRDYVFQRASGDAEW